MVIHWRLLYGECSRGWSICFFFQAEDGIRDLVRSRGLGDVYKRQHQLQSRVSYSFIICLQYIHRMIERVERVCQIVRAVSYTHLTLPTSDLV